LLRQQQTSPAILGTMPRAPRLTRGIAQRIADEITAARLPPGAKLATEQQMIAAMGVSRTVVREAIAALRAQGLVVTRQGAGAFVAAEADRRPFQLAFDGLPTIAEVLEVMELRASVEIDAAGLAAERAGGLARRRVDAALREVDGALERGEDGIEEDAAFHRAIAAATGNMQFGRFLDYLGRFIIPRQRIWVAAHLPEEQRTHSDAAQAEHVAIATAIAARQPAAAREAMRQHLAHSQLRYRRFAMNASAPAGRR
jgi:GntR family transcriptional regulator, transcriptional repressor for pyruvate dehydrogenase complex